MYCVMCGVKLADSEKKCPLCATPVCHPDAARGEGTPLYPSYRYPEPLVNPRGALIILSALFLLPILITLLCDFQINGEVTWSGIVIGAIAVGYATFVLPFWFSKPNPAVFTAFWFALVCLYVMYINFVTGGSWFLTFALPVTGITGFIITGLVALLRYTRKGRLFVFGGAAIAMGAFMPLMEFLLCLTFDSMQFISWSLYPFIVLVLFGVVLLLLALNRRAQEVVERKFFI